MTSYFKKYMEDIKFKKVEFQSYFDLSISVKYTEYNKNENSVSICTREFQFIPKMVLVASG